jgi:hypothetical protein
MNAAQINRYLRDKGSPLAGYGGVFVREARKNHLDPLLLVAITGAESSFGTQVKPGTYNPFGWGPHIPFKSWGDGIATVARGLRKGYFDEGLKTIAQIGSKWAPAGAANDPTNLNSNWSKNVGKFYTELGGTGFATTAGASKPQAGLGATTPGDATLEPGTGLAPPPDLSGLALQNLATVGTKDFDPVGQLADLTSSIAAAQKAPPPIAAPPDTAGAVPETATPTGGQANPSKWLILPKWGHASGAAEPSQPILTFAAQLGKAYGKPLQVWDTTGHSKMTTNGRVSAHWTGNALDLPARGAKLMRLGRLALMQAGMPRAQAMRAKAGLYNVGGPNGSYQVIFGTNSRALGGDHRDHVHIALRG